MKITANPCINCGSSNQRAKWDSDGHVGWVHCDGCGRISEARPLNDTNEIIAQWNRENPIPLTSLPGEDPSTVALLNRRLSALILRNRRPLE